jgi:hypothetical protein
VRNSCTKLKTATAAVAAAPTEASSSAAATRAAAAAPAEQNTLNFYYTVVAHCLCWNIPPPLMDMEQVDDLPYSYPVFILIVSSVTPRKNSCKPALTNPRMFLVNIARIFCELSLDIS